MTRSAMRKSKTATSRTKMDYESTSWLGRMLVGGWDCEHEVGVSGLSFTFDYSSDGASKHRFNNYFFSEWIPVARSVAHPVVRVLDGSKFQTIEVPVGDFNALDHNSQDSIFVTSREIVGDHFSELILAARSVAHPVVRVLDGSKFQTIEVPVGDFNALDHNSQDSIFVTSREIVDDHFSELILAARSVAHPVVRVLDGSKFQTIEVPVGDFNALDHNSQDSIFVTSREIVDDHFSELILAAGPGGDPHIRALDGITLQPVNRPVVDFYAYDQNDRGGINVAIGDVAGDGTPHIVAGQGKRMVITVGAEPTLLTSQAKTEAQSASEEFEKWLSSCPDKNINILHREDQYIVIGPCVGQESVILRSSLALVDSPFSSETDSSGMNGTRFIHGTSTQQPAWLSLVKKATEVQKSAEGELGCKLVVETVVEGFVDDDKIDLEIRQGFLLNLMVFAASKIAALNNKDNIVYILKSLFFGALQAQMKGKGRNAGQQQIIRLSSICMDDDEKMDEVLTAVGDDKLSEMRTSHIAEQIRALVEASLPTIQEQRQAEVKALVSSVVAQESYETQIKDFTDITCYWRDRIATQLTPKLREHLQETSPIPDDEIKVESERQSDHFDQKRKFAAKINDQIYRLGLGLGWQGRSNPCYLGTSASGNYPSGRYTIAECGKRGTFTQVTSWNPSNNSRGRKPISIETVSLIDAAKPCRTNCLLPR